MRKYEAYVDSEIEWVGEMPSHWKKIRHKNVFNKVQDIVGEDSSKYDVLSLTIRGVIKRDIESNIGKMPASFDGYQIVKPNSLLLCLFDIDVTPRCIGYVNQDGITTSAYTNIKVKNNTFYAKYYYYWFLMLDMDKTLLHLSKNLRNSIGITEFMALTTIYPPVNEQKKISCYLDKKIKEIDDTVALMNIYIEKVLENRQSIITEAVTKGLNPNVKMKDSGVEWIGEIPEHWKVTKIKYNTYVKGRIGWQGLKSDEFINEGPYLVTGTDFKHGYVNWNTCYHISEERYEEAPPIQLRENDLLITKDGTIGKLAIVKDMPYRAILNSGVFITRPLNNQYLSKYMYWLLSSNVFNKYISLMETGSTIKHLYQETFVNFSYPIPSLKEQGEIVEYLNIKISEIDKIGQLVKEQIEKLKEYRQALIYEAVTGKIDVREMEID